MKKVSYAIDFTINRNVMRTYNNESNDNYPFERSFCRELFSLISSPFKIYSPVNDQEKKEKNINATYLCKSMATTKAILTRDYYFVDRA